VACRLPAFTRFGTLLRFVHSRRHPLAAGASSRGWRSLHYQSAFSIIDLETKTVAATVPVGARPYATAFAGGKAFITNQGSGSVSVIDLETLKGITTIKVGDYPEGIEATKDGRAVYVACWADNMLVKIDVSSMSVAGQASVGDGPRTFGTFLR